MKKPLWLVRTLNYEYWPLWLFFLPLMPYWLWLSLRCRSLTWFTATNTNIEAGGFYGESKINILRQLPESVLPNTVYLDHAGSFEKAKDAIAQRGIQFPCIAKPDVGGRGKGVEKITSFAQLEKYHALIGEDYIVQDFVEYPIEAGIFYVRQPDADSGKVTSIVLKEFLSVTGDGHSTIRELMEKSDRARFQLRSISDQLGERMQEIIPAGERRLLEPIGNHARGTRFINGNHLIDDRLHEVFNRICLPIAGFYYGRFDLKLQSIEALYRGEGISVIELNGASSDPGHIYDPATGLFRSLGSVASHWKQLARIARVNMKNGIRPASFREIWYLLRHHNFSEATRKKRLEAE